MLQTAKGAPDFTNYLAFLLGSEHSAPMVDLSPDFFLLARSAAAIMLKNDVKSGYKQIPAPNKEYLKSTIVQGLRDPNAQIRNYAGNVITEVVRQGGIMDWPQVLAELVAMVDNKSGSESTAAQEGAMSALLKICEDNKRALDKVYQGERPLAYLFPQLLTFTTAESAKIRSNALASINVFLPDKPQTIIGQLDQLMQQLSTLASDHSEQVRKHVCRSFVHLAEVSPERIVPHMGELVNYMINQQKNDLDPELALDAAEFWLCVGEHHDLRESLRPFLAKVVPVLLESMVYCEEDILRLEGESADAEEEDNEQDIKPAFAASKAGRSTANGESAASGANGSSNNENDETGMNPDDNLSEGEIEDFEDDEDPYATDPEDQWNLRKCSAAALDVLASVFHNAVFQVTLPYLQDNINHPEWPNREAAVLALGAIADGCMDAVTVSLPILIPHLLSLLRDNEPVVRQITCWTLGRYSGWAAHLPEDGQRRFFEPIMDGILQCMLDTNKKVQEAAASAFANLEEKANQQLNPYVEIIIERFVVCFGRYKDRNIFILYDCVQTLAEHAAAALRELMSKQDLLMPALIQRWNKVPDQSREMFPLLECLSYVATALADKFVPFSHPIFTRCIHIIHQNLETSMQSINNPEIDKPEQDFLVTSLDLLSAIIQAVDESHSSQLVQSSSPNFFELLIYCMKDSNNDVRQSAYALLGDCAIYIFPQLQPCLPSILEIAIAQMDLSNVRGTTEYDNGYSVINNACWSLGEIAMRQRDAMAPYVERLLQKLAAILFNPKVPESLTENAAIALGRLGIGNASLLAPHLASFAPPFLRAMTLIGPTDEKGHALTGFGLVVLHNPQAMENGLLDFLVQIADYPKGLTSRIGDVPAQTFEKVSGLGARHYVLDGFGKDKRLMRDF